MLHLPRKIISANLKIWCSKMQPLSRNHRPDLPTAIRCLLYCACHGKCIFKCPTPAIVFGNAGKPSRFAHFWERAQSLAPATRKHIWTSKNGANMWCFVHFDFGNVLRATTACTFSTSQLLRVVRTWCVFVHFDFEMCFAPQRRALSTSQLPKVVWSWCVLYVLAPKSASHHNGMHFFDIATSKSGPNLVCFVHVDFETRFAPQRRALFRHRNFQKWSGPGMLCTFWLGNVLRATTACNFSSLIWPAGSAPAALVSLLFKSLLFICPYCRKFDF